MDHQELQQDLTQTYLKLLIAEVSGVAFDFDVEAPFGELGIDSFHVIKIIRKLEGEFGRLPKTLLFECFTVKDLAAYFVSQYEEKLSSKFALELRTAGTASNGHGKKTEVQGECEPLVVESRAAARNAGPILILEAETGSLPELHRLVHDLYEQHKAEGCVSRGTRRIAPYLFIGSAKRGYVNYGRSRDILLVYSYTGPREYFPALLREVLQYATEEHLQLNILSDRILEPAGDRQFSATPFGVLQRIENLKQFSLQGGAMRRLRYLVSKFEKSGDCKTEEYRCGADQELDRSIATLIDKWCDARAVVNPLVHDVKKEVLAGKLRSEHRLFLTYLDGILQNTILITAMSAEENGFLMDLEFYSPEMAAGALDFAIVRMVEILAGEGYEVLSLGGTYGCKLEISPAADPEIDRILDDLRAQNIFNDEGNFQFKNKFRPKNATIYLCRPAGSGDPDNVLDIIMMIAAPENACPQDADKPAASAEPTQQTVSAPAMPSNLQRADTIEGNKADRWSALEGSGFNPLRLSPDLVEIDLKTDSWAQLQLPAIEGEMRRLHAQLQQPVDIAASVKSVFPFPYFVLTDSGQAAERLFFRALGREGVVLQNLLFPSTIFHQLDSGLECRELPHPEVFELNSKEPFKGNVAWEEMRTQVVQDPAAIACVCIEVGNNAAGGNPVSLRQLRELKELLRAHSIPLVLDATRVVENAQLLLEREAECAGSSVWAIVQQIFECADAVIGSLTKDFSLNKGGIVAARNPDLYRRLQQVVQEKGSGVDVLDQKIIALALGNRKQVETRVLRRMAAVRQIFLALVEQGIPVVQPAGGHCILIDVKQIEEYSHLAHPAANFVAWLYLETGIRAAAHSVGMQKQTPINELVRLAIPVGLPSEHVGEIIKRLTQAFAHRGNITELVMDRAVPLESGTVYANYKLLPTTPSVQSMESRVEATSSAPAEVNLAKKDVATPLLARDTVSSASESDASGAKEAEANSGQIAVIGMAGRYPKAKNLKELWENLAQGRDCIDEMPADRYQRRLRHGSCERYRGGFLEDIDKFDSLFFNISPREAEMLDPQERLFLETVWEAIEDAGYHPEILTGASNARNVGVFVGAVWAMYQMLGVEEKHNGNEIVPNSFLWSIANRVSYWMNFSGPSLTVDTACSSSLTALHLACESIAAGECSVAVVGGVNLDLHQAKLDINRNGGALSPDGVCRSFGRGANGYVAGEGVGALLIKPLDAAIKDGDNVYGVIKSTVVNHGGRTSGYTVPSRKAQTELVRQALEKAKVDPRTIGYVEAHGTGTELGDPIEIEGLTHAFKPIRAETQTCAIGSIKGNIGHLEAAAGVASIAKVLLQMKHRQLVPSLHSSESNEFIDFKNSPFYVVQKLETWNAREACGGVPLRAGISSFGAGGSNAHVILESYEGASKRAPHSGPPAKLLFPLSAREESQLRVTAERLVKCLQQGDEDLADVAHTLQAGRKAFDHRLAIIAEGKEELLGKLEAFLAGKQPSGVVCGLAKVGQDITRLLSRKEKEEFVRLVARDRDPQRLAQLWVEGLVSDGGAIGSGVARRVSLPTYPFADKRHWAFELSSPRSSRHTSEALHPLIDVNESTFERQLFRKVFSDGDFCIHDHRVDGIPTVPGVAHLELARKAGELAANRKVQKIRNVVWVSPIVVQNGLPAEIHIELKPKGATVRFEVFSTDEQGGKRLHSQGSLLYATEQQASAPPEFIDLKSIAARSKKVIGGTDAYPRFKAFGLDLGPSFQVLQEVSKNDAEILGSLKLPYFREADLKEMTLHPSLVDGAMQAGMGAELGAKADEMFVPFSIGEVEILQPLTAAAFSYVTDSAGNEPEREKSRIAKHDVAIVDETGKVLVRIKESAGIPLKEVHKQAAEEPGRDAFQTLYYGYDWHPSPLAESATAAAAGRTVLFARDAELSELYQQRLQVTGANGQFVAVAPGDCFQALGEQRYTVNPRSPEDFDQLFSHLVKTDCVPKNICFAWTAGVTDGELDWTLQHGAYPLLSLCQSLIRLKLESSVQVVFLHYGKPGEQHLCNEAVAGFVNALHLEHPRLICKVLRVESDRHEAAIDAVTGELTARVQDATSVRYTERERFLKKLTAIEAPARAQAPAAIRENGTYLITGGAGGLGLLFAEFLAREYRARLILTGRSANNAELENRLAPLRAAGAEVTYIQADVSRRQDVEELVRDMKAGFGKIHGIIHAAGVLRDSLIRNKTVEEMRTVLSPKVHGTVHLDEVTREEDLDFFVVFSSLASVAGNAGQCDYSFANYYLDSFATQRERLRALGLRSGKTLSINWSLWADGGMKIDSQTRLYFEKTLGLRPLAAATGLAAFVGGLTSDRLQFAVLEGVQEKVESAWGLRKRKVETAALSPASLSPLGIGMLPASVPAGDLEKLVQEQLARLVVEQLKIDPSDLSADKILLDLGFDSIGLTSFANAINEIYDVDIAPVLFFDYPSIEEIARYLATQRETEVRRKHHSPQTEARKTQFRDHGTHSHSPELFTGKGYDPSALDAATFVEPRNAFQAEHRFATTPVAVVGISGVMPQSEDLREYWDNLRSGRDLITEVPEDRWRWEDYYGDPLKEINKSNSKWGGFMKEVDKFDALFFGISPREAKAMDPQQRIFLETVWKAIEDSGHKVSDLSGTRTGIFVGVATNDYANLISSRQIALDGYTASGNSHSVLANRVSFLLNLRGPSAPVDTACSSSLVALHRAVESIYSGSCDMAIAGGVQVMLSPAGHISFSMAGMLSGDGQCKSFDKNANGYVRGEGCGAIFLKPLSQAEREGDHIYAVIRATAENHSGRVTTMTAPNSAAQSALLIEAYEKAQIDPATVGYIECHGIGSSIGDPIETQALTKAFAELFKNRGQLAPAQQRCALSSVKPNIGHLETAAGVSSLLKALLAIKHKSIPATIHCKELNPYIHLEQSPFYIAQELTPWTAVTSEDGADLPRRGGVSAFGFGGANAHAVLEEYIAPPRVASPQHPQLIILSAKNEDRLKAYASLVDAHLEREVVEMADLAYTLQVGRDEMQERLALVADDLEDLRRKLQLILRGEELPAKCYRGSVRSGQSIPGEAAPQDSLLQPGELSRLAQLWVAGAKLDWTSLHQEGAPRRISLPTYPFARERHWIAELGQPSPAVTTATVLPAKMASAKDAAFPTANAEHARSSFVQQAILRSLASALSMDAAQIRTDVPFPAYGTDSMAGVTMVNLLNEDIGISLEPARLFEYITIDQLRQYICHRWPESIGAQLSQSTGTEPIQSEPPAAQRSLSDEPKAREPIAVIGMSGRFAGSETLEELWYNLQQGKCLVGPISRWSAPECLAEDVELESQCTQGAFIESADRFDPAFFGIAARDAKEMDPQQRLFLEECWKALEDAGHAGSDVKHAQCGVYVGCGPSHYEYLMRTGALPGDPPNHAPSLIPAQISYYLDLHGPAMAIDTACSSALVALHLACQSLWMGETDLALAGGVSLLASPDLYQSANRAGVLSATANCYSFDARADGFVPGEGVGVVVLKRLAEALRDGDHIHGVIAGTAVNHVGSSNDLIAAKARAQQNLERSVYERFQINPTTLQVVEAHSDGTILGDSVEYNAMSGVFTEYTDRKQFCAIGTVKTNIGHAGAAAGIAGLLKVLLSLKHGQIPPSLHFRKGNPTIDFQASPFYVNTQLRRWRADGRHPRRAAVNSFGSSGTNAHLVIEEAPAAKPQTVTAPGYLVVLSARTADQLQQQIRNLLAHLRARPKVSMNDLSFTLLAGRAHFHHRFACFSRHQEELLRVLEQWLETGTAEQASHAVIEEGKGHEQPALKRFGNHCVQECRSTEDAEVYLENLAAVTDLYCQGYSLDFQALFPTCSKRISLPSYPFARERHWVDQTAAGGSPGNKDSEPGGSFASSHKARVDHVVATVLSQQQASDESYEKVTL